MSVDSFLTDLGPPPALILDRDYIGVILKEPPAQSADPQARPAKPKRGVKKRQLQQEGEYERSRWHGQYLTNWTPAYGERKSIGSASCSSPVSVVLATLSGPGMLCKPCI